MFKTIVALLFLFIMLAYVFSSNFITSKSLLNDLTMYDKNIQLQHPVPKEPKEKTLEEEIVSNIDTKATIHSASSFFPILESVSNAAPLE
jgi:hypothetical protein